ncbi:MAG: glycosyltransferase [Deltaproteobacteria bacterium]|nr:glycosyltransferase [Deltaproteobacteria bacterium]
MIIRIDDYPHGDLMNYNRLLADPNYDHREHVYHFLQAFEKTGVPYVLGVSPGLIDLESDLFFLQTLRHCEVAMHGFSHGWSEFADTWHKITETWPKGGEFAFDSKETIRDKIKRGLDILGEFRIQKFIPPFNAYTQDLLDILNELGFKMIMGGRQTIQFHMDKLDHGDLILDICVPPLCNDSDKILPHLEPAIRGRKTILLHWIYEPPANVTHWTRIAETVKQHKNHELSFLEERNHQYQDGVRLNNGFNPGSKNLDLGKTVSVHPVSPTKAGLQTTLENQDSGIHRNDAIQVTSLDPGPASTSLHAFHPYQGSRDSLRSLPIAMVTETMNYISGGVRCIAEVLNGLVSRGYQAQCHVTLPDLGCSWLETRFPILPARALDQFHGILISPYSPTSEMVARSKAKGKFYWVHSYEPKFPEITGRPDSWRTMSENSYRLEELQYIATSSYVRMILELIYKRKPLSPLVPGGVDTSLFRPGPKGNHPLRVMFLSRENTFRGTSDIIEGLRMAHDQGYTFDLRIMGQALDIKGLPHTLIPALPQKEFAALLGTADIFIHASHFEGLPLPPLEAMASRCAVISTYIGASDYLLHQYNALVVPPKRPDKIAQALIKLAIDPNLRERLGNNGYDTVLNGYTWDHTIDHLEEALEEGMNRLGYPSNVKGSDNHQRLIHPPVQTGQEMNEKSTRSVSKGPDDMPPLVSAIVSTYNSEKYIKGCLEDLEAQTIARRLEIIVVDSASQQNERAIVKEFQRKYDNIVYIRTDKRESVYEAWNRGIKASRGIYITNANTDDRHRKDAFERMADVLDTRTDIALVYADVIITKHENETFERCTPFDVYYWLDWDRRFLLEKGSFIGPQPMWRRTLHDEYGYFDGSLKTSGDYEFWLRISQTNDFLRIPILLGLYLESPDSIEHRHKAEKEGENIMILEMYQKADKAGDIIRRAYSDDVNHLMDVHNAKAEELYSKGNVIAARIIFKQILNKNPALAAPMNNLGVMAFQENSLDEAISWFERALQIDPNYFEAVENMSKCLEERGDFKSATEWYRRALVLRPDEIYILNALGNTLVQTENILEAKEVYERSLQLDDQQDHIQVILREIAQLEGSFKQGWQANCT